MPGVLGNSCRMGKGALKKCLFPRLDRCHGSFLGDPHCSCTDNSVVVTVPIRRHIEHRVSDGSNVVCHGANPETAAGCLEQQRRVWVLLAAQTSKRLVSATIAEKHRPDLCGT